MVLAHGKTVTVTHQMSSWVRFLRFAAESSVANWLVAYSRARMFSVSIPPSAAAAALTALKIFERQPELHSNLKKNVAHFAAGLRDLGYPIRPDHPSAVFPVVIGDEI